MRKIISIPLFLALFCTNIVLAQKQTTQEKELLKVYNKSELNNFKKDNDQFAVLCYAIDHAIYMIDAPKDKDVSAFPEIAIKMDQVPLFTDLNIKISDRSQYFRVAGQNKLLIVKSMYVLQLEMNKTSKQ
ncbi:MAG: hypothetical protein NT109_01500 [Flavobacteriia bacterium]|nr:hypothetical protein [Flavobacteriia bacterium]